MPILTYTVPSAFDGATMQSFLRRGCGVSARLLAKLKRVENGVTADGILTRSVDRVRAGQVVRLRMPEDVLRVSPIDLPLSVVYEDADVLVVDKPPYLAVHPSAGREGPTLAAAVTAYFAALGEPLAFRPVNRLDRNTSGLLLIAKNAHAAHRLGGGLDSVEKEYLAVAQGTLKGTGFIDQPIRVREGYGITREVGEGGKPCRTRWETLAADEELSLLRVRIETGRTHQIRVHMAWLGHPLAGDTMYGGDARLLPRHGLHCHAMRFTQPAAGNAIALSAALPDDMTALCASRGWPISWAPRWNSGL